MRLAVTTGKVKLIRVKQESLTAKCHRGANLMNAAVVKTNCFAEERRRKHNRHSKQQKMTKNMPKQSNSRGYSKNEARFKEIPHEPTHVWK